MATKKTNAGQAAATTHAQIAALQPEAQLPPTDAAIFLRVTEAQLEKMRGAHIGPRFVLAKISGVDQVRYAKPDLEDWLAANKTGLPVVKAPSKK